MKARMATAADADGIAAVCDAAWRATYRSLVSQRTLERAIAAYYDPARIAREIAQAGESDGWLGWVVVDEGGEVVGGAGGGIIRPGVGQLYVIYVAPDRRGEGIGTVLLDFATEQQRERGAREQWVSVMKGNALGVPFYEARGFELVDEVEPYDRMGPDEPPSLRYRRAI